MTLFSSEPDTERNYTKFLTRETNGQLAFVFYALQSNANICQMELAGLWLLDGRVQTELLII